MIRSEEKLKGLAFVLKKNDNTQISDAIEALRKGQPFIDAIGLITSFYDQTDEYHLRKKIEGFMTDLKDQSATKEVINELRKNHKPDTISMLVSSCWQSGLNYSDYALDFIKIFLKGDYVAAIECLTVIEEFSCDLTRQTKDEIIKTMEENPFPRKNEKSTLMLELKTILNEELI
jgi:hypothetical protein